MLSRMEVERLHDASRGELGDLLRRVRTGCTQ